MLGSRADDLGKPLPESPHAVSVCLPTWQTNVGYEEADPAVMERLQAGYPRFVFHPTVQKLFAAVQAEHAGPDGTAVVFPSRQAARRAVQYAHDQAGQSLQQVDGPNLPGCCVVGPAAAAEFLKQYWQHSGEIVSSRLATDLLAGGPRRRDAAAAERLRNELKARVATLAGGDPADVYLFPTGMAAVFCAYRAMCARRPGPSVQFGFPYVDILKIQQRFGTHVNFYPQGDDADLDRVAQCLKADPHCGVFVEFPGNPLLTSPDLARLSAIASEARVPLLIDDTLAAMSNLELQPHCDFLATSLTKYFSGVGDVMGGSLILNRDRPLYAELKAAVESVFEDLTYNADLQVLEHNSRDTSQRVARINANALQLCESIAQHPMVEQLNYPAYTDRGRYDEFRRPDGGFGGLFSIVLKDAPTQGPRFFDRLEIPKGPNLGTNFSLCCPYTILAHFNELQFAEECGISPYLIRVSVGLEPIEEIQQRFLNALDEL